MAMILKKATTTFLTSLLLVCILGIGTMAVATTPEEVVQERTEAVASLLAEPDSLERTVHLAEAIDESLDFEYLAARAFGEHWEARTDEEKNEFLTLLRALLQANYADRLGGEVLGEDYRIEYGDARMRRDRAFVQAEIAYKDRSESVIYRLYQDGERWRIYDLVVDDISLEETYRDGYVPIIEEDGWDELISLMKERLEEMESP